MKWNKVNNIYNTKNDNNEDFNNNKAIIIIIITIIVITEIIVVNIIKITIKIMIIIMIPGRQNNETRKKTRNLLSCQFIINKILHAH